MSENFPLKQAAAAMDANEFTPSPQAEPITLIPARYVLLPVANVITGYTVKAMQRKIERGDWPEGKLWRRAPDGRILIDIAGYHRWVEGR